ncbi:MAG: hypothetical protein QF449_00145 [Alphaproteobacteria bacterium]|jgi:hypothetical protein|nr:hypothetical protein [Alphaproteobacteria bacterium]MDP6590351.1 hypothetical protein [Alphaproteobacteria bacterium]MDP6816431.1 hypothetical protein [Alphaproteobacteria bacterium]|tara:strand:+ start:2220 stop:2573 length:354 start_codon:yes stop_codon:yes gene_type:complete
MAEKAFKSPKQGVLKRFGYQVGARGPMRREREKILHRVFAYGGPLEIEGVDWAEWGAGESPERLHKMSNTLYALKTNLEKKKERGKNQEAITDYDRDLEFLKTTYYDGRFEFHWPDW